LEAWAMLLPVALIALGAWQFTAMRRTVVSPPPRS